jgi:hypothetical protein
MFGHRRLLKTTMEGDMGEKNSKERSGMVYIRHKGLETK